jgi:FAD/FMN-containing dehydrogenase
MRGMSRPAAALPPATIEAFKALLGPGGWLDAASDRAPFETDFRRLHTGATPLVALPDSTEKVAEFVAACARARIAIVPQGGNTSYCGGATPRPAGNEILLSPCSC